MRTHRVMENLAIRHAHAIRPVRDRAPAARCVIARRLFEPRWRGTESNCRHYDFQFDPAENRDLEELE